MPQSIHTESMTQGAPSRAIIKFAIPLILGYLLQQMYLIIDAAIVGRWIGVNALAAVGASSFLCQKPPIFLILTIYLTFTLCVAKQMLSG